jgi:hypothetical protein
MDVPDGFGGAGRCLGADLKLPPLPPDMTRYNAVSFQARGGADTSLVEISLVQSDGNAFGINVPLSPSWSEYTVPLADLRPMWSTQTNAPDLRLLDHLTFVFGTWLFGDLAALPHRVDIQQVSLLQRPAAWPVEVAAAGSPIVLMDGARCRRGTEGRWAVMSTVAGMDPGRRGLRIAVDSFPGTDCSSLRLAVPSSLARWHDEMTRARYLLIKARAGRPHTDRVEIVVIEADGSPWGVMDVPLTAEWQALKIPLDKLKYFAHWGIGPAGRGGPEDRLKPGNILAVNICFGAWLFPQTALEPHAIEIQEVSLVAD